MALLGTHDSAAAAADSPKSYSALWAEIVERSAVFRVPEGIDLPEVPGASLKPGMFVAGVTGTSMEPLVPGGSWCLFRPCPVGSLEGRIVLVQLGTDGADDNGVRFTVKKSHSKKSVTADGWRHDSIWMLPVNPAFEPIEIERAETGDVTMVGEYALVLSRGV